VNERRLRQCVECGRCIRAEAAAAETKCELHRDLTPTDIESLKPFVEWLEGHLAGKE
jgi:hypothetical protein